MDTTLHFVLKQVSVRTVRVLRALPGFNALMILTSLTLGLHPLQTPPVRSHTHEMKSLISAQHWAFSSCVRGIIRKPVSSQAIAYTCPCLWPQLTQSLTCRFILLFMKACITELIATAKHCHLKLALWKDQKGLCPMVPEFSKRRWICLEEDMEDTFWQMWFRLKV